MKAHVTRDSVCAADDFDPPHARTVTLPDGDISGETVAAIVQAYPLPGIDGGRATWCLSSGVPLAVVAQQWAEPRLLSLLPRSLSECDVRDGAVRLHFSYLVQIDPDVVFEVLRRLRLTVHSQAS